MSDDPRHSRLAPPLAGITVVDFSELLPGPFFTQNLVEMGARVIKIERPPAGDNVRRMGSGVFSVVNRGKESRLVDLKDPRQRAETIELVETADVMVESYRPGVMAKYGLDYASLAERCPRLVVVSLSGYGQQGPWANLPGHDINYLAAAGVLAVSGVEGDVPAQSFGLPVADLCGAMYATSATLAALFQRQASGRGQHLDVALADCALHWMNPRIGAYAQAEAATLAEQREATLVKPAYGAFACSNGRYVSVAALEDHFWLSLTKALDLRPFDGEAYRSIKARKDVAGAINRRIGEALAGVDSADAFERLRRYDVPVAPMIDPFASAELPQFASRGRIDRSGPVALARFPVSLDGMHDWVPGPSPALGAAASAPVAVPVPGERSV